LKKNAMLVVWLLCGALLFAQQHWVGTWASSPQLVDANSVPPAPGLAGNTLRQIVHVSVGGKQLRVRFSNAFGTTALTLASAQVAVARDGRSIDGHSDRALAFHGQPSVTIPPGALVLSDPVAFDLAALSDLAVTIHVGDVPNEITTHSGSRATSYITSDSGSTADLSAGATKTDHWYFLNGVDVLGNASSAAIVTLGDSITDGARSTTNQNGRWPDELARRLQANPGTADIGVLNQGIGGNRLIHDGAGPNVLARFDRDVLGQTGVRWLVILEGINDIGTRTSAAQRNEKAATAQDLIAAYEQIIVRAHARNIRVYGATILPYEGAGYFTPDGEADRQTINAWIRTGGKLDGVIDLDLVTRDPEKPSHLAAAADSGDHLHPADGGYKIMGDAIDLKLFPEPPTVQLTAAEDHQRLMDALHMASIRQGASGSATGPNPANYDEAKANPYPSLPDPLTLANGKKIKTAKEWWTLRRPEIVEEFDREIYGRMPKETPKVSWEVTSTAEETNGEFRVVTKKLIGHVDNASFPQISVDIQVNLSTPAGAKGPVPVIMEFGFIGAFPFRPAGGRGGAPPPPPGPTWQQQVLAKGWGYAVISPNSVQADNGAGLTQGIIGLVNKGQPRKPDDWGALRAWAWGASRALDYFETDKAVNAKEVGLEGHSRYGKATVVAMAYDERFAVAFVSSSGEGGAKLHRRNFGELVENVAGSGEYHWMAGNFMKYAGPLNWNDLPVDSHELVALCAPRPVFISAGTPGAGDGWVDAKGSFLAAVGAGPVYKLLGKKDMGASEFPPVETALIDGDVAFRQHNAGHTPGPNWPTFITFASRYLK
jgi:lysophospholipase L1-like esterase